MTCILGREKDRKSVARSFATSIDQYQYIRANFVMTRTLPAGLKWLSWLWLAGLLASGWSPYDRATWLLEVFPALIALPVLWATWRRLELTPLLYGLIAVHGLILMVGGAYTYARVPLGFWMQDWFGFSRNHYDRIGHLAQGLVPAIVARELLLRVWAIPHRRLVAFLSVCICLAISAFYELIEWWTALWLGQGADEFLGTQGDPWDTQADMFFAMIGAIAAVTLIARFHDRQMAAASAGG
jgi:putative membrane protein